jgi:thioredoxin-dependent peroxiredoxin
MTNITLGGNPTTTNGSLPAVGSSAPDFNMTKSDMSAASMADYKGSRVIMNIFPSVDTGVCATSVRKFNEYAVGLTNTKVLCISRDLPFAQKRFCGAEGISNVEMLSDFATGDFGKTYGVNIEAGGFTNLHARAIVVLDENGVVTHTEIVPEVGQEPNYDAALGVL